MIEDYLVDAGELRDDSTSSFRQLKDRVSRALNGSGATFQTIRWFVESFDMNADDEMLLWDAAVGRSEVDSGISHTLRDRREMVRPQDHRTVAIAERYLIDGKGGLVERRTTQTIKATGDSVDVYVFNHEPEAIGVEVIHGGKVGRRHEYGEGLVAVEIVLERPLGRMKATALEYRTSFGSGAEVHEVRRAAFARAEHVDFAVEFSPKRIPREVWWCAWDDHFGGEVVYEEPVPLKGRSARRYVPYVEDAVVGFRWRW